MGAGPAGLAHTAESVLVMGKNKDVVDVTGYTVDQTERLLNENRVMRKGLELYRRLAAVAPTTAEVEAELAEVTSWEKGFAAIERVNTRMYGPLPGLKGG